LITLRAHRSALATRAGLAGFTARACITLRAECASLALGTALALDAGQTVATVTADRAFRTDRAARANFSGRTWFADGADLTPRTDVPMLALRTCFTLRANFAAFASRTGVTLRSDLTTLAWLAALALWASFAAFAGGTLVALRTGLAALAGLTTFAGWTGLTARPLLTALADRPDLAARSCVARGSALALDTIATIAAERLLLKRADAANEPLDQRDGAFQERHRLFRRRRFTAREHDGGLRHAWVRPSAARSHKAFGRSAPASLRLRRLQAE
jgi:hypothetical protein